MDIDAPLPLLGGLSPARFMQRHWQRKPLLVRGAAPGIAPLLDREAIRALAVRDDVESRIVEQGAGGAWKLRRGPFGPRGLPAFSRPRWTVLLQGLDLHLDAAHALLRQFRFIPDARLDDVMVSHATDGGGVGPHFDSYDVFLLQVQGRRRWRWGRQRDLQLRGDVPLKILERFDPEHEAVLEPGDMLYLPPRYAHDGVAEGECQTCSIGFRAPARAELARELLQRIADHAEDDEPRLYADAGQPALARSAQVPAALQAFAADAVRRALDEPGALAQSLGETLTEPKANVVFTSGRAPRRGQGVVLDRRTRMLYDDRHVFVNGESWRAGGADARLMRKLADERSLSAADLARAGEDARALLAAWCEAGWAHAGGER